MNNTLTITRTWMPFVVPLLLFIALMAVIQSPFFQAGNDLLSLGLTLDLLLTIPLVYFLLIRKTEIPKTTVVPMMILGLVIGKLTLPLESQVYLNFFKAWGLPIVEGGVLIFILLKVKNGISQYRANQNKQLDFYTALKQTCEELAPKKVAMLLTTEIAVIYYGFINWKTRELEANEFSYHKRSSTIALLGALLLIITVETLVFHILIALWSHLAAWIVTALSIYTCLQVFGFIKSLSRRPIAIQEDTLALRYGILSEVDIPFEAIEGIELTRQSIKGKEHTIKLSPIGDLESHNILIHLNQEMIVKSLYGIKKPFHTIALHVDQVEDFKMAIEKQLGN